MAQSQAAKERAKVMRRIRAMEKRGYRFSALQDEDYSYNLPTDVDELREYSVDYLLSIGEYSPTAEIRDYMRRHGMEPPKRTRKEIEYISGEEGRKLEKQYAYEKSRFSREQNKRRERFRDIQIKNKRDFQTEDPFLEEFRQGELVLSEIEYMISTFDYGSVQSEAHALDPQIKVTQYYVDEYKRRHANQLRAVLDAAINIEGRDAVARRCERKAATIQDSARLILYGSGGKDGDAKIQSEIVRFAEILKGGMLTNEEAQKITDLAEYSTTVDEEPVD